VFCVQPHTRGYPHGAFGLDGVADRNSMVRALAREREANFSSLGRFKKCNTLLPGVALYMDDITCGVYCTEGMLMR
jgi:hypothetical protein